MEITKSDLIEALKTGASAIIGILWDVKYIVVIIAAFGYFGSR